MPIPESHASVLQIVIELTFFIGIWSYIGYETCQSYKKWRNKK